MVEPAARQGTRSKQAGRRRGCHGLSGQEATQPRCAGSKAISDRSPCMLLMYRIWTLMRARPRQMLQPDHATPGVSRSSPRPTKIKWNRGVHWLTLRPVLVEEHDPFQKRLLSLRGDGERMALPGLTERHRIAIKPTIAAILLLLLSRFHAAFKQLSSNLSACNLPLRKERK